MKNSLKKALSIFLVTVMVFGVAPLTGFVGLELPEFGAFQKFANSVSNFFEGFTTKAAAATKYTEGYYTYSVDSNGNAKITDVDTAVSGDIIIPSTLGGYSVTSIGGAAFENCTGLTSITIPESVTSIADYAFQNCAKLTSVNFGENSQLTSIGGAVFRGCAVLTSITIPESVTSIGGSAFENCTGFASITLPDSVTSIGNSAFNGCTGLTSVTIPKSVTSIGNSAFNGCAKLTSVDFGEESQLIGIGFSAFKNCTGLISITIPDSVTSIGGDAFENCTGLTSITIPDSVTSIGSSAFENCTGLTSITIPDSVTSIGEYVFTNTAYYHNTSNWSDNVLYIGKHFIEAKSTVIGSFKINEGTLSIAGSAFYDCDGLTGITIPESVTSIGIRAFRGCTGLTSITIPESVTSIGGAAFSSCDSLKVVNFNAIDCEEFAHGYYSHPFYGCTALTTVNIGEKVTNIPDYAFYECRLTIVNFAENSQLTSIGWQAFDNCTRLTSITLPDSVTSIGMRAFYNCEKLTSVTISESVTSIGMRAFYNCASLEVVNFNAIDCSEVPFETNEHPFYGCTALTTVNIGEKATCIPEYAFYNCAKLTNVNFGENSQLTSIGNYAFYDCDGLTSVTIPKSVTSIGNSAFFNCAGLTSITIPENVTSIGSSVFYGCAGLASVNFGENSQLTSIGGHAFYNCKALTSITIPGSVTSIGSGAFYGCYGPANVFYTGDIAGWCSIKFSDYSSSPLYFNHNHLYIDGKLVSGEIIIPAGVTGIGDYAFYDCDGLTSVTIPKSVTSIGNSAFYDCDGLTSVNFGENSQLTSIGVAAFRNCTGLTSVTIPKSVTSIGNSAFNGCAKLTSVDFGEESQLTSIGNSAFNGCAKLTSVNFGENSQLTSIGNYAFERTGLTSITIPVGVTRISDSAFENCTGLTSVNFAENSQLTSIGKYAFYNCTGLTSITIPANVTIIDEYSFYNCDGLISITILADVTSIGEYAFSSCNGLSDVYFAFEKLDWEKIKIADNNTPFWHATWHYNYCSAGKSHVYTKQITIKEPTCEEKGKIKEICKCGYSRTTNVTRAHWYEESSRIEATCTEEGTIFYICKYDSSHTKTVTIEKAEHKPKDVKVEASCTAQGMESTVCENCGAVLGAASFTPALGHNFVEVSREDATCTEDGTIYYECSRDSSHTKTETIDKKGHSLGKWATEKEPTCTEKGVQRRYCENCDYYEEQESFALGHNFVETSRKDATCTEDGTIYYECSRDSSHTKTETIDKKGHSMGEWITDTEPTCTEEGSRHKDCANCDYSEEEILDATGHSWNDKYTVDKDATCTEEGSKSIHCTRCEEKTSATVIPALGHNFVEVSREDATCTEDGIINYECSRDSSHTQTETVNKNGHSFGGWITDAEPTCTENGSRHKDCKNCDYFEKEVLNKTGHSWNDKHIIDKPATCTEEGSKSIHCSKCNEKTSVIVISMLGHNYVETSRKDATCTVDGTTYYECSRNSGHKKTEVIPAKGHTSGEWKTETEPTINTEGKKVIRCIVCQEILEAEVIPMLKSDTVVDDDTGISMDYAEEKYEGEVKINVEEKFEGVAFSIIDTKLGPTDGRVFDITMTVDGVETQPNGKVIIKIPLPEGFNYNNSFVYYINDETGTFDAIPSRYENGYIIFETDHFSYYAVVDITALTVNIRKPSVTTISYGDAIILHADVDGKLPAGATIKWESSNGNFDMDVSADGTTCKISPSSKGDTTFTVSVVDAKGKVISSDEQTMTAKAGFFDKIIAFFKKLFGLTKTIPQVYKGIF